MEINENCIFNSHETGKIVFNRGSQQVLKGGNGVHNIGNIYITNQGTIVDIQKSIGINSLIIDSGTALTCGADSKSIEIGNADISGSLSFKASKSTEKIITGV